MKNIVLKSNHGTHSGFNRKWTVLGQSENIEELKKILFAHALNCSDDTVVNEEGAIIDLSRNSEVLYSNRFEAFSYDGISYVIVTQEDYDGGYFCEENGFPPTSVRDYFEKD